MTKLTTEEIQSLLDPKVMKGNNEFAPKLTFEERCQILALDMQGVSRRLIAAAYKVNRSTVNFVCITSSPHYRNVRRRRDELGRDAFIAEYVDHSVIERINAAKADPNVARETSLTNDQLRAERAEQAAGPKKGAKSHEGRHCVRDPRWDQSYWINVTWLASAYGGKEGWAVFVGGEQVQKLMGEPSQDFWHHSNPMESNGTDAELFDTGKQAFDSWCETHGATLA